MGECACVDVHAVPYTHSYSRRRARMDLHGSFEGLSAVVRVCSDSLQVVATIVCVSVVHTQMTDGWLGLLNISVPRCAGQQIAPCTVVRMTALSNVNNVIL